MSISAEMAGREPHPHRRIWRIAAPAILANISGPMVGVVDTWALGHLPDARALAAIAVGAFVFHFVYWSFGFLRMGTTGATAQAFGAGKEEAIRRILLRSALLGLALGIVVLAAQAPLFAALFTLLAPDAEVSALAATYCGIRIWGAPAILLRLAVVGMLVGTQRVRLALLVELLLNGGNAALTVLFVTGLGWGMAGAAAASLAAETFAAALAAALALRLLDTNALVATLRTPAFRRPAAFFDLLRVNTHLFLRTLLLLLAFALLWRTSAGIGTLTLAANQVLIQFLMIASFGLDGLAYAAEALIGEAKGRMSRPRLRQMAATTTAWAVLLATGYGFAYALFGESIIAALTAHADVRAVAKAHLAWLVAMPLIAVASYQLDGIFIGATETRSMLWTMLVAFAVYALALHFLVPRHENDGLWAAMAAFLAARGLGLALYYPGLERRAAEGSGNVG